ncbi:MAG TPA: hypothetical protein VN956_05755 [Pyrinomonadaceae bacterium]|nr:hypothetical protein [Pyrinomonadaceae bacterium]
MTDYILLGLAVISLGICVANWRIGFLLCIIVGCVQDPIRKIIPGEPIYMTSAILIYVAATCLGAYLRGRRFSLQPIHAWNNSLKSPLTLFMAMVVIQSVVTFIKFGSPILATIGFLAYVTPVPGILLGYHFGRREQGTYRFIKVYLALNVMMVAGVYLSYFGLEWQMLNSVGEGLVVYSMETGALLLRSGFFRAPEVAAWHAGTSICLLVIMFMTLKRHILLKLATGGLILFFWGALLFTGRRKFIMEIMIFLCVYGALLLLVRKRLSKTVRTSILLAIAVGIAMAGYVTLAPGAMRDEVDPYYERSATVGADATERASLMTSESFGFILERNGPWGAGAGTGSQGAQYFGGGADIVGGAAEGGLGKIVAELGLPGIALIIWLAFALGRYFWAIIREVQQTDFERASLIFGFIAMLAANAFVFVTAHQIFGDPFVLTLLGFLIGIVMAVPRMASARLPATVRSPMVLRPNLEWQSHDAKGEA